MKIFNISKKKKKKLMFVIHLILRILTKMRERKRNKEKLDAVIRQ